MPSPNGTVSVTNGTHYDADVHFECDTGFRLDGTASSICQISGQWVPGTPTCQLIGKYCFLLKGAINIWMQKVVSLILINVCILL